MKQQEIIIPLSGKEIESIEKKSIFKESAFRSPFSPNISELDAS